MATRREHQPEGVDIDAWTEQAINALSAVRLSGAIAPASLRRTTVELDIPLDAEPVEGRGKAAETGATQAPSAAVLRAGYTGRREPLRRDSMKRREALLRGKEGSRRRQRWENNRLLGNPWMEPPEPRDFDVRPTHPVHTVPYYLAQAWDERYARAQSRAVEQAREASRRQQEQTGRVPRELRQRLKRSKAAKGMLQDLEEQVRDFVRLWDAKDEELRIQGLADADSSEDEEIVFVGRNGQLRDDHAHSTSLEKEKLIFESAVDDQSAAFGRWLVHSIAAYYNLRTWSRTLGSRREAYVGIKRRGHALALPVGVQSLQPLWVMV